MSKKVIKPAPDFFLYYEAEYHKIQMYGHLESFVSNQYECHFSIQGNKATCLSQSPIGGLLNKTSSPTTLDLYMGHINQRLKSLGVHKAFIIQPPNYYHSFVSDTALADLGWKTNGFEWNQFVDLKSEIVLHSMQQRHLGKVQPFHISVLNHEHIERVHAFISTCRQSKGLEINISLKKLAALFEAFPQSFDLHVVTLENQIISAVVMVKPTKDVCYYYLPATDSRFTKYSPMVHLLNHLYAFYRKQGFGYMDLGISSINEKKQTGLFEFKQRMGAKAVKRWVLQRDIK